MIDDVQLSVNIAVLSLSLLLHLVILVRLSLSHFSHLRPVHIFQINYFLGLCLLCTSGESQLYSQLKVTIGQLGVVGISCNMQL